MTLKCLRRNVILRACGCWRAAYHCPGTQFSQNQGKSAARHTQPQIFMSLVNSSRFVERTVWQLK